MRCLAVGVWSLKSRVGVFGVQHSRELERESKDRGGVRRGRVEALLLFLQLDRFDRSIAGSWMIFFGEKWIMDDWGHVLTFQRSRGVHDIRTWAV
jgi:hypothetical protein